jgi:chromosome segregation ATPase
MFSSSLCKILGTSLLTYSTILFSHSFTKLLLSYAEAKDVFEYKKRNAELDDKVKNLDTLIVQRDTEVKALKQQIVLLEKELLQSSAVASSGRGGIGDSSAQSSFNSRAKIETKRRTSESKLRALMGQVTNSIDKRSRDPDGMGMGAVRSIPLDSDGDESTTDEDGSNAGLLYRGRVEEMKVKLKATEETLAITHRELEAMRRQVSPAHETDGGIGRSKSMDAADAATSAGGRDLALELNMEKARATSLQHHLSLANDAVRARDESNADLRESLKEAVSLLKPLKEHVAQAESQKEDLRKDLTRSQQRIDDLEKQIASRTSNPANNSPTTILRLRQKEQEVQRLQKEVKDMEEALFDAHTELSNAQERLAKNSLPGTATRGISNESSATSSRPLAQASNQSTNEESDANIRVQLQRAQNDLNEKRRSEELLKQSLERTQGQLQALSHDHEELIRVRQLVQDSEQKLKAKDDEIVRIREQLRQTQVCLDDLTGSNDPRDDINRLPEDEAKKRLEATQFRISQLQDELTHLIKKLDKTIHAEKKLEKANSKLDSELLALSRDLEVKTESERKLNKSLKEAVDILKPLQGHVMTVEKEKIALLHRLKTAESRVEELESLSSRAVPPPPSPGRSDERSIRRLEQEKELLEQRVHQLERDAIDADQRTLSSTLTQDVQKLQEQLVDVQKKYENTKEMLDQSAKTNASLLQDLKEMEDEDDEAQEQIAMLEQKLIEKDRELAAAKHIATTAMVKVDSMSVHSSVVGESQDVIAKLEEDLKRSKQKKDRLVAFIRQRDQEIISSSADSTGGRRITTPMTSEANTDVGVYHLNELGLHQSGGQDSGAAIRWMR